MGYGLLSNYANVFLPLNKNSKETLFEVQFAGGIASGAQPSNFTYVFLPRSIDTSLITPVATNNKGGNGWNTSIKDVIDTYETAKTVK